MRQEGLRRPTNETGCTKQVVAFRPARRTARRRSKLFLAPLALQPAVQAAQFRSKFLAHLRILLNDVPDLWRSSYEAYIVLFESLPLFPIQRLQFLVGEYKIYLCHGDSSFEATSRTSLFTLQSVVRSHSLRSGLSTLVAPAGVSIRSSTLRKSLSRRSIAVARNRCSL